MLASTNDLRLAVAGQTPKVALEVAHTAIQFCKLEGWGGPSGERAGPGVASAT